MDRIQRYIRAYLYLLPLFTAVRGAMSMHKQANFIEVVTSNSLVCLVNPGRAAKASRH